MLLSHISENIPKTFYTFSSCSGLKPNFTNGEVAGIGILKGVKMSHCGIKSVDLTFDTLQILNITAAENAESNPAWKNYHFQDSCFVENLERIEEHFIWKHIHPKIQHKTVRMDYKKKKLFVLCAK